MINTDLIQENDLDHLKKILKYAENVKSNFDQIIKSLFPENMVVCGPIKEINSIIKKAKYRKNTIPENIQDIVRAMIICPTYEDALNVKTKVFNNFNVLNMEDFFQKMSLTGFRDINIKINFQEFVVEILIILEDFYNLEQEKTRKVYDKIKKLLENQKIEKDLIIELMTDNLILFNETIKKYNSKTDGVKLPVWDINQLNI